MIVFGTAWKNVNCCSFYNLVHNMYIQSFLSYVLSYVYLAIFTSNKGNKLHGSVL